MNKSKIAISLDYESIRKIDYLVRENVFPNRSQAIQEAVKEKLERIEHTRLERECSKLDSDFEKAMAEEGLSGDLSEWPEF